MVDGGLSYFYAYKGDKWIRGIMHFMKGCKSSNMKKKEILTGVVNARKTSKASNIFSFFRVSFAISGGSGEMFIRFLGYFSKRRILKNDPKSTFAQSTLYPLPPLLFKKV